MKKPRLMEMKQFVPSPTAPNERARVCTEVVNFILNYFGKINRVEMESDHSGVKQELKCFQE